MSETNNVLPFRLRDVPVPAEVNLDGSFLVFAEIGELRRRVMGATATHAGRNVMIQVLLAVARLLLDELEESSGGLMTPSGLHRRNANLRVRQLLELASEVAALDVHVGDGE